MKKQETMTGRRIMAWMLTIFLLVSMLPIPSVTALDDTKPVAASDLVQADPMADPEEPPVEPAEPPVESEPPAESQPPVESEPPAESDPPVESDPAEEPVRFTVKNSINSEAGVLKINGTEITEASVQYEKGTDLQIEVLAKTSYRFNSFSVDGKKYTEAVTLTLEKDIEITADLTRLNLCTITNAVEPDGAAEVLINVGDGMDLMKEKTVQVEKGTKISVEVRAIAPYQLKSYSVGDKKVTRPVSTEITVQNDLQITAELTKMIQVTVISPAAEEGTLSVNDGKQNITGSFEIAAGTKLTLNAKAKDAGWNAKTQFRVDRIEYTEGENEAVSVKTGAQIQPQDDITIQAFFVRQHKIDVDNKDKAEVSLQVADDKTIEPGFVDEGTEFVLLVSPPAEKNVEKITVNGEPYVENEGKLPVLKLEKPMTIVVTCSQYLEVDYTITTEGNVLRQKQNELYVFGKTFSTPVGEDGQPLTDENGTPLPEEQDAMSLTISVKEDSPKQLVVTYTKNGGREQTQEVKRDDNGNLQAKFDIDGVYHITKIQSITEKKQQYSDFVGLFNREKTIYIKHESKVNLWVGVDTEKPVFDPEVSFLADEAHSFNQDNNSYNGTLSVTVKVSDPPKNEDEELYSGLTKLYYWLDEQADRKELTLVAEPSDSAQTAPGAEAALQTAKATLQLPADLSEGKHTVYFLAVDAAGNESEGFHCDIIKDTTAPVLELIKAPSNRSFIKASDYTFSIGVKEAYNLDPDALKAALENACKLFSNNYAQEEKAAVTINPGSAEGYDAVFAVTVPASYNFKLEDLRYADKLGNMGNVLNLAFTVDNAQPQATITEDKDNTWTQLASAFTFGMYNAPVKVTFTAEDGVSPISYMGYFVTTKNKAEGIVNSLQNNKEPAWTACSLPEPESCVINGDGAPSHTIEKNREEVVFLKVSDKAGNVTYACSDKAFLVDTVAPVGDNYAPELTVSIAPARGVTQYALRDAERTPLFDGDVEVTIRVRDPKYYAGVSNEEIGSASGLNNIEYTIEDGSGAAQTVKGTLVPDSSDPESIVYEMTKTITVKSSQFNSNQIKVSFTATDNSENESEAASVNFAIDVTRPEITITPAAMTGFQNKDQTFTISVRERNFDESQFKLNVTATDGGVAPGLSGWSHTAGSGNRDNATHTATLTFNRDGIYRFTVNCKDLAGNTAAEKSVGEFILDKTAPRITVTYDNNQVTNGKYFNAARTATITIVEHNFDPSRVTFTPAQSVNWNNQGDSHIATIAYTEDGDYTFDVSCVDKADNASQPVDYNGSAAPNAFTVDTTYEDMITISNVEDGRAYSYSDTLTPKVEIHDTNFDSFEITLTGKQKDQTIDLTEKVNALIKQEPDGVSGIFDLFPKTPDYDGIYTLHVTSLDKAGNQDEEMVRFTVNRFGSVFEYDDKLNEVVEEAFHQSIDQDLTFTIYNASPIDENNVSVIITRDGKPVNVDYTVTQVSADGNSWYEYLVTIKSGNFAEDGVYTISLATTDDAKNTVENTEENSEGDIVFYVDSVAPELTSVIGLEEPIVNDTQLVVRYSVYDTIGLASVQVKVDGEIVDEATAFDDPSNYEGSFTIYEKNSAQHVSFILTDKAGNVTQSDAEDFEVPYVLNKDVTVSTNLFVRWFANKPLFFGGIGGGAVALGGLGALLGTKKKKKEDATAN